GDLVERPRAVGENVFGAEIGGFAGCVGGPEIDHLGCGEGDVRKGRGGTGWAGGDADERGGGEEQQEGKSHGSGREVGSGRGNDLVAAGELYRERGGDDGGVYSEERAGLKN